MKKLIVFCALIFLLLSASGCRTRAVVTTRPQPPAALVVRPPAPRPGYIWIDGNWAWRGGHYVYQRGYWAAPRRGHAWVPGRWERRSNGWMWRKGYWR